MGYFVIIIAMGIILLFGYWSETRRTKSQKSIKPKVSQAYPLSNAKRQTKLRRIK